MSDLHHVSYQILLKAHNGDHAKATAAWEAICRLGGYGSVPTTYEGGLDVTGLRISLETPRPDLPQATKDDIKRIEDLAAGDKPTAKNTQK